VVGKVSIFWSRSLSFF